MGRWSTRLVDISVVTLDVTAFFRFQSGTFPVKLDFQIWVGPCIVYWALALWLSKWSVCVDFCCETTTDVQNATNQIFLWRFIKPPLITVSKLQGLSDLACRMLLPLRSLNITEHLKYVDVQRGNSPETHPSPFRALKTHHFNWSSTWKYHLTPCMLVVSSHGDPPLLLPSDRGSGGPSRCRRGRPPWLLRARWSWRNGDEIQAHNPDGGTSRDTCDTLQGWLI